MRLILLGVTIALTSCKSTSGSLKSEQTLRTCTEALDIQALRSERLRCITPDLFAGRAQEAQKRDLGAWIPCNSVRYIDGSLDLFGPSAENTWESVQQSNFAKIHREWLGKADRFSPELARQAFENLGQSFPSQADNPILQTEQVKVVRDLIRNAQHDILFDIFLIGGSLGAQIMRDLAEAAERGVQVILLHDNVSKFNVANEMDPLWEEALRFSLRHPKFVALEANISPPNRPSSAPFGAERISVAISQFRPSTISAEAKSDHSKILLVDTMMKSSREEYLSNTPKMWISSHNLVDSAASFYHDEGVVVEGPAAVMALLSYGADVYWAWESALQKRAKRYNSEDKQLIESFLQKHADLLKGPLWVKPAGTDSLQVTEISANDEIRNLDSHIMTAVVGAKKSLDIYGKLIYNWPLAIALKEAMARGVQVRIIMDQQTSQGSLLNASLPYMIRTAKIQTRGKPSSDIYLGTQRILDEADLPIRWFLPFRPGYAFNREDRSNLAQEIHSKTMIVDGRYVLLGTSNFDSFTWAGGFREYSVYLDSPAIADQASKVFDRLWNHPYLSVSHRVWLGKGSPDPHVVQRLKAEVDRSACDKTQEVCQIDPVLQGGRGYDQRSPFRELIRQITEAETRRIKAVFSEHVQRDPVTGDVRCEVLR